MLGCTKLIQSVSTDESSEGTDGEKLALFGGKSGWPDTTVGSTVGYIEESASTNKSSEDEDDKKLAILGHNCWVQ